MNRTRAALEAAWAAKSERPLAVGLYSVSLLAKISAGSYARRILSREPSSFPPFLSFSGNAMGEKMLDVAGVRPEDREFNLYYNLNGIAMSGHPDGTSFDDEARTVTVLETKRLTFPTPEAIEQATRQALAYAALFRTTLIVNRGRGERMAHFDYPPWHMTAPSGISFPVELADYAFNVQIVVAGAFEGEIHDVAASPELLGEVLREFYSKAQAIHESALAGTPTAADAWDARNARERPVESWAEPPAAIEALLATLATAKRDADSSAAHEEAVRAELRDAMRAANVRRAVGSGISAAWVEKRFGRVVDEEALRAFLASNGKTVADFEVERTIREVDQDALAEYLTSQEKPLAEFETVKTREDFVVRASGGNAKSKEQTP